MEVIEAQYDGGVSGKIDCDLCNEEPENSVLFEKPNSMIVRGQVIGSYRPKPIFVCLECLEMEADNI